MPTNMTIILKQKVNSRSGGLFRSRSGINPGRFVFRLQAQICEANAMISRPKYREPYNPAKV
jgi:hypothetical protein